MNISEIIAKARGITGYKLDSSAGDLVPKDPDVQAAMSRHVRDLNRMFGGSASVKEKTFTASIGQQDYLISTYVGSDVFEIEEVLRSGSYMPDFILGGED